MNKFGFDLYKTASISALNINNQECNQFDEQIQTFLDYTKIIENYDTNQNEISSQICPLRKDVAKSENYYLPKQYITSLPECNDSNREQIITMNNTDYQTKVGLEIHAQLTTNSKMFCSCENDINAKPNENTCPVCLGYPGCLPSLNVSAVKMAILVGKALHCDIHKYSRFDRKNYFYPDMSKSYQITQYYKPICTGGYLVCKIDGQNKSFALNRIHIEEDAAKLIHLDATNRHGAKQSSIDYNRAGVPLIEIVTEPVFQNGNEAAEFVKMLRVLLMNLGVCKGNLEDGNMRVDANVSVIWNEKISEKTEIKNLNSFRSLINGIKYEANRISTLMKNNVKIVSQTRLWDEKLNATFAMRSKETLSDYRYFPEPDLPPLVINDDFFNEIICNCSSPVETIESYIQKFGIEENQSRILVFNKNMSLFYNKCFCLIQNDQSKKILPKWFFNELLQYCDTEIPSIITEEEFVELLNKIANNEVTPLNGKEILKKVFEDNKSIKKILFTTDYCQINDKQKLEEIVKIILEENKKCVDLYHNGQDKMFGFFVGQVMKKTNRRANAQIVHQILQEYLDKKSELI